MASPAARASASSSSRGRWTLLTLLIISVGINYIDRGNLSVAAHDLSIELHLDPGKLGLLLSAFFWTYAICLFAAGWVIDRFNVYWVYAASFLVWSGSTALTGAAAGFTVLFSLRLLLGMSESVAYPSYSKIICSGFAEHERGLANGLIDAGSKIGPALGVLIGGLLVAGFGWRFLFYAVGAVSLIWLLPWCWSIRKLRVTETEVCAGGPPIFEILTKRDAWGTFIGLFCGNYVWYFLLTWLPPYLQMDRHFSDRMMAIYGSLPFWVLAFSTATSGWLSDVWIRRGASPTRVRKTFVGLGLGLCTILLPASMIRNSWICLSLFLAASLFFGLYSSNLWAITQTLSGREAAGRWTGLQNGFGNFAGIAAPWLTGIIVKHTGSFFYAFVAVCGVLIVGCCSFLFVVREVKPVQWKSSQEENMGREETWVRKLPS